VLGRAPLGRVPPASFSTCCKAVALRFGNPFARGKAKGAAAARPADARSSVRKCILICSGEIDEQV